MACCWHQWSAVCPRGKQAAAGTMGLPSLACSAERVSFVLRFVRANAGREGGPEGAQREPHSVSCPDGWFLRTLLPEEASLFFQTKRWRDLWKQMLVGVGVRRWA